MRVRTDHEGVMRFHRPSPRLTIAAITALAALGLAGGYGVLVLSTNNQPGPATLPSAPIGSQVGFSTSDPGGKWVVDPRASNFAGYRAKELLAVDFVASPNDAVGRTTQVEGSIDISSAHLVAGEIRANVKGLRSDQDLRDQHLIEGLKLGSHPTATFTIEGPIDLGAVKQGSPLRVEVPGALAINGQTKPVVASVDARWDGASISIAGSMTIHRADFELAMPQLLVFRVADDITIEFEVTFAPSCAPSCVASAPSPSVRPSPVNSPAPIASSPPSGELVSRRGRLAFAGLTDRGESAPPVQEIYTVNADGSGQHQLTKQEAFAEYPAWSPDGLFIAYTLRREDQELGLWVVGANGTKPRQVTAEVARHPAWSPDGKHIAFVRPPDAGGSLYVIATDGTGLAPVVLPPGTIDYPTWSPDGRLTFTFFPQNGNHESIYVAGANGTHPTPLIESGTYSYAASWARNGRQIAFVTDGEVATANADASGVRVVTSGRATDRPDFSPDAKRIVFTQNDGIWIMNADGSGATQLILKLDYAGFASWDPIGGA